MHGYVGKNLDDNLPFQLMAGFFLQIYSRGFLKETQHVLILNGHGSHVTIQALK